MSSLICTACEELIDSGDIDHDGISDYCPSCGACLDEDGSRKASISLDWGVMCINCQAKLVPFTGSWTVFGNWFCNECMD